jgi:hypothetical protein
MRLTGGLNWLRIMFIGELRYSGVTVWDSVTGKFVVVVVVVVVVVKI